MNKIELLLKKCKKRKFNLIFNKQNYKKQKMKFYYTNKKYHKKNKNFNKIKNQQKYL